MATDTEKLVVLLEARVNQFEKNMAKASRTAGKEFDKIERRAKQSGQNVRKSMGDAGKGVVDELSQIATMFTRGGVIGAAVAGTAMAVKQLASSVAEVGREARKAGVSAETWQRWHAVAVAAGATIDGMSDGLKELNLRADEFVQTDAGPAAESFKRLGYSVSDVARKLKDPDALLEEILGKIRQLDAAAQTRVLDEIFGGTGAEQMAKMLGLSVEELRRIRSEAATLSDQQIEAAAEIDRKWDMAWRNFTIAGKGAILDVYSYLEEQFSKATKSSWFQTLFGDTPGAAKLKQVPFGETGYGQSLKRAKEQETVDRKAFLIKRRDQLIPLLAEELQKEVSRQIRTGELDLDKVMSGQLGLSSGQFDTEQVKAYKQQIVLIIRELAEMVDDDIVRMNTSFDELHQQMSKEAPFDDFVKEMEQSRRASEDFATAITTLKRLVPELAKELDALGEGAAIDAAFRQAAGKARSMGEIYAAASIAERAHASRQIGQLPGNVMDRGREVYAMLRQRGLNHAAAAGITGNIYTESRFDPNAVGDGGNSHGLFQHHKERADAMFAAGGRGNAGKQLDFAIMEMHRSGLWEQMQALSDPVAAAELFMRRFEKPHKDYAKLGERQEFARVAAGWGDDIGELNPSTKAKPQQDSHIKAYNDELARQAQVRKDLNSAIQESLSIAEHERQLVGLSASQKEVERQVFAVELEARRQGIELSQQEIDQIRAKVTETVRLQDATEGLRQTSEEMRAAKEYMAQSFTDLFTSIISGASTAEEALKRMLDTMISALIQGALMGTGPFGALVGGVGLFPALMGFSSGGKIRGRGTGTSDSILARVSDGEFVVKASQARKHAALLEAINSGRLPAFASGGWVKDTPSIAAPTGSVAPQISINNNVKVEGSAGTPEQNADLARRMSRELESVMRGIISQEMRRATRPGNFANQRGGR